MVDALCGEQDPTLDGDTLDAAATPGDWNPNPQPPPAPPSGFGNVEIYNFPGQFYAGSTTSGAGVLVNTLTWEYYQHHAIHP